MKACARQFGWEDLSGKLVEGMTQNELKGYVEGNT